MKNVNIQDSGFRTSDIGIAAFLLANQTPMTGIHRENDHLIFLFAQREK